MEGLPKDRTQERHAHILVEGEGKLVVTVPG